MQYLFSTYTWISFFQINSYSLSFSLIVGQLKLTLFIILNCRAMFFNTQYNGGFQFVTTKHNCLRGKTQLSERRVAANARSKRINETDQILLWMNRTMLEPPAKCLAPRPFAMIMLWCMETCMRITCKYMFSKRFFKRNVLKRVLHMLVMHYIIVDVI
jgi:hypothetical protein